VVANITSEFNHGSVVQSRNPIVKIVLVLAALAFVGISIIPIFEGIKEQQASSNTSSQTATASAQKSELQAQEKGYELVLKREPENATALRGLLETRLQLIQSGTGEVKDVVDPLEKLVKINPNETRYAVLLAQVKQQLGDRESAAQAYRTVLATNPGDLNALQGLVLLLVDQKRPEAAIGLLEDTLQAAPQTNKLKPGSVDVPAVQLLLGQVYAEQKRYDEAIALYDQVSGANKQDFRPFLGKALLMRQQGKNEAAQPLFQEATSLAPPQYKDQIKQLAATSPSSSSPAAQPAPASPAAQPVPTN